MTDRAIRFRRSWFYPENLIVPLLVSTALVGSVWIGRRVGGGDLTILSTLVKLLVGAGLALTVWRQPYLGLVITAASLPITDVLPKVTFATSIVPVIGGLTFAVYILQNRGRISAASGWRPQHVLAGLFVLWQFASNPTASVFGTGNWLWTYAQLWGLLWLAGEMLGLRRVTILIWCYVAASLLSAGFTISEGRIGASLSTAETLRSSGLAQNPNQMAGYLIAALVFAFYLYNVSKHRLARIFFPGIYALLIVGVAYTVSRTGFWTLVLTILLLVLWRNRVGLRSQLPLVVLSATLLLVALLLIPAGYWGVMGSTLRESVFEDPDMSYRLFLWDVGMRMWADHPITGIGIGRFGEVARLYVGSSNVLVSRPHNMYVTVLVETGVVGLIIWVPWLVSVFTDLLHVARREDRLVAPAASAWLVTLMALLFMGLNASTLHYDKLLWLLGGISVSLRNVSLAQESHAKNAGEQNSSPKKRWV